MKTFGQALRESAKIFSANPKFIVPRLIVAALYGVLMIYSAQGAADALSDPSLDLLKNLVVLLVATFVVVGIDVVLSSMYPFMASDVLKGKQVNLRSAFNSALSRSGVSVPAYILVLLAFTIVSSVVQVAVFAISPDNFFPLSVAADLILAFGCVFIFYFLFPVVTLEKKGIFGSLRASASLSLGKKSLVAKATVISFIVSAISYADAAALAFLPQQDNTILFWVIFVVARILSAYVYAYLYVLNPLVYLKMANSKVA